MSDLQSENSQESSSKIQTPSKRTPSKRLTQTERAQLESVEVIKSMGGSLDIEGGRRTRSSVRGNSTPATPPPIKKSRQSSSSTTTPKRGRPKKLPVTANELKNEENSVNEVKEIPEKNDNEIKNDETTVEKPDAEVATTTKSDTTDETCGTENLKTINKNVEDNVTPVIVAPTLPSTEKLIEKTEVDASKLEQTSNENHIENKKPEKLTVPDVVVRAATPEKQHSTNNVPDNQLDPIEPMEVDSSISEEKETTNDSVSHEEKSTKQSTIPTTNNSTILVIDEDSIENNLDKDDDDVQEVIETKKSTTDELPINKTVVAETNNIVNDKLNAETPAIIPQNDNKLSSIVENDKQQQSSNENKVIAESEDKKENDSCEPKISSPPSNDGIVQPQTCN